jgi:hypothetical protein
MSRESEMDATIARLDTPENLEQLPLTLNLTRRATHRRRAEGLCSCGLSSTEREPMSSGSAWKPFTLTSALNHKSVERSSAPHEPGR